MLLNPLSASAPALCVPAGGFPECPPACSRVPALESVPPLGGAFTLFEELAFQRRASAHRTLARLRWRLGLLSSGPIPAAVPLPRWKLVKRPHLGGHYARLQSAQRLFARLPSIRGISVWRGTGGTYKEPLHALAFQKGEVLL